MRKMDKHGIDRLVKLGMLTALAVLFVVVLPKFRLIPALPFLEYDMADVPILIGTFLYGPWWGLLLTAAASVVQGVTVSADSGVIGILMHVLATGAYVVAAGTVYRRLHTFKGALLALLCGTAAMTLAMIPLNYFISPVFLQSETMSYEAAQQAIGSMLWLFIAFNALKAGINSLLTLVLYKSCARVLRLELIKPSAE